MALASTQEAGRLVKLPKILAIISAISIAAIGVTGGSANAAASPWTAVYLHAFAGNGCASYTTDQHLEPITSEPCANSSWWYYRDLSRSSGVMAGDKLEFVDLTKTYALGYSGGEIKLETPNDSSTYVLYWGSVGTQPPYGQVLRIPADSDDFILPNGAGDPLQLSATGNSSDLWIECPLSNPTCSAG